MTHKTQGIYMGTLKYVASIELRELKTTLEI